MSCCGKKRADFLHQHTAQIFNNTTNSNNQDLTTQNVVFEYTGPTGLTATGPITGRRYRFAYKGDKQAVDYRDAPSMMAISVLKKVA